MQQNGRASGGGNGPWQLFNGAALLQHSRLTSSGSAPDGSLPLLCCDSAPSAWGTHHCDSLPGTQKTARKVKYCENIPCLSVEDPLRWSYFFAVPLSPPSKMRDTEKQKAKCPLGHPNLNMVKLTLEWSISFLWTLPFNLYLHNPFLMFLAPVVSHPKSDKQELIF